MDSLLQRYAALPVLLGTNDDGNQFNQSEDHPVLLCGKPEVTTLINSRRRLGDGGG